MSPDARGRERVEDRVRRRGEAVADREVEEALRRLEAAGGLNERQRRVVEAMTAGIVESLLAVPAPTVAAARREDLETLETVVELFDPGE